MWQSKPAPIQSSDQLTVSSLLECNCPAFKDIISKFGRKQNLFMHCKHFYFIFVKVSNVDPEVDLFIHAPTFSFNEVTLILEGGFLTQFTSYNFSHPSIIFFPNGCGHFLTSCELIIFYYNKYNFMNYLYSLQNFVLQYSNVSCVSLHVQFFLTKIKVHMNKICTYQVSVHQRL
jgi:hypothetical protein